MSFALGPVAYARDGRTSWPAVRPLKVEMNRLADVARIMFILGRVSMVLSLIKVSCTQVLWVTFGQSWQGLPDYDINRSTPHSIGIEISFEWRGDCNAYG